MSAEGTEIQFRILKEPTVEDPRTRDDILGRLQIFADCIDPKLGAKEIIEKNLAKKEETVESIERDIINFKSDPLSKYLRYFIKFGDPAPDSSARSLSSPSAEPGAPFLPMHELEAALAADLAHESSSNPTPDSQDKTSGTAPKMEKDKKS